MRLNNGEIHYFGFLFMFQRSVERQSPRLSYWDYRTAGDYFVTICTQDMAQYFGNIDEHRFNRHPLWYIAKRYLKEVSEHLPYVKLLDYVIMPNHIHGIFRITQRIPYQNTSTRGGTRAAGTRHGASLPASLRSSFGPQRDNLGLAVNQFKGAVKRYANKHDIEFDWQERYHDRIIWDDKQFFNMRHYIHQNISKYRKKYFT